MKFFSWFRFFQFVVPLLVVTLVGFQVRIKQPSEQPISPTVPTSSPVSSVLLTPSPQNEKAEVNITKSVPSSPQIGTDDLQSTGSPKPSTIPSSQTKDPVHFFYQENGKNLVKVGTFYERKEYLTQEAAEAFKRMKLAAQQDGIELIIVSGFRSVADQEKLFKRQIQRQGSPQAATRLSAPPGFSEHHTGYALDIGDGKSPDTILKIAFDSTKAYGWLEAHASQYGFELSFPKNNPQGVSYEPWHWRFVGSPKAEAIFLTARGNPG